MALGQSFAHDDDSARPQRIEHGEDPLGKPADAPPAEAAGPLYSRVDLAAAAAVAELESDQLDLTASPHFALGRIIGFIEWPGASADEIRRFIRGAVAEQHAASERALALRLQRPEVGQVADAGELCARCHHSTHLHDGTFDTCHAVYDDGEGCGCGAD